MSRITVERSHSLGLAVAREKAEALAQRLASEYDVKYRWSGDTLEFKRSGADGTPMRRSVWPPLSPTKLPRPSWYSCELSVLQRLSRCTTSQLPLSLRTRKARWLWRRRSSAANAYGSDFS